MSQDSIAEVKSAHSVSWLRLAPTVYHEEPLVHVSEDKEHQNATPVY